MPLGTFLNSSSTPERLRSTLFLALSDTGQIGTASITSDGGGGGTATWSYGADVPCRIDPLTSNEVAAADRITDRSTHLITVPPGLSIAVSDRFAIDGRGTFEITAVQSRTGEQAGFLEAVQAF